MAHSYDAFVAAWNGGATLPVGASGTAFSAGMTTQQKIDALNGWTVAVHADVSVSTVQGNLMLNGAWLKLKAYAATALAAAPYAQMLVDMCNSPSLSAIRMGDAATYSTVKGMLDALLADATNSGITQSIHDGLLALASATVPWWQNAGYIAPFNINDATLAGVS